MERVISNPGVDHRALRHGGIAAFRKGGNLNRQRRDCLTQSLNKRSRVGHIGTRIGACGARGGRRAQSRPGRRAVDRSVATRASSAISLLNQRRALRSA